MRNSLIKYSSIITILLFVTSCAIQRSRIFKIPRSTDYAFDTLSPELNKEYKIAVGDRLIFSVLTNNGESMFLGKGSAFGTGEFTVQFDSTAYIPLIGNTKLAGLTTKEAEEIFKNEFSKYINDPYIKLTISNGRIVLFKGLGSSANIIQLTNSNTTILEVIAIAGGIPERGNAKKIKLVRKVNGVKKIYLIDLSTIDKIENGDMLVQSNDYIYIETSINYLQELSVEFQRLLTPISIIISSATLYKTYVK